MPAAARLDARHLSVIIVDASGMHCVLASIRRMCLQMLWLSNGKKMDFDAAFSMAQAHCKGAAA